MSRLASAAAAVVTVLGLTTPVVALAPPASSAPAYDSEVEDYASYTPQRRCRDTARPGTRELAAWIDRTFDGGAALATVRPCDAGGTSEHKAGRAIDWMNDATDKAQRQEVRAFLDRVFATDRAGNAHALARRMGVMYIIWNDHMWASYDHFDRKDHGSCKPLTSCSATARHRDHVHISLSRRGARGKTSWYERG